MGPGWWRGVRLVAAAVFVFALLLGLGWVLRSRGLDDAADVAQLVSLAPLVGAVVVWAWRRSASGDAAAARGGRAELIGRMAGRSGAGFVERPAIGARLVEALEAATHEPGRPVVLTGAGGFGKTMLAAWACQRVGHRFPDGVLWVELGQQPDQRRLVDLLTDQVRLVTGTGQRYETVSAAAAAFAGALAGKRVLLVIDDAWREQDVEPFLRGGDRCVRLVTTRRPPVARGHEIMVDAMTADEAVAVLRDSLPGATADSLRPLLRRCGHWPLALSLVAGTLASLRTRVSITEAVRIVLAEFDRAGVAVLDELSDADDGRGVAVTLALSMEELAATSPHRRESLTRYLQLAAFPEEMPIPYQLLERLWRVTAVQAKRECDRFRSRSLVVQADGDGVRLHDVVGDHLRRRFAAEIEHASRALLNACRPAKGWHALAADHPLWTQLAHHLLRADPDQLAGLTRDGRFLVARLDQGGPLALEADLLAHLKGRPDDAYACALLAFLRQEAHLLSRHQAIDDLALTLHSRLVGHAGLLAEIARLDETLPATRLVPERPFPDRASPQLVRVLPGHHSAGCSLAWHPDSGLLLGVDRDGTMRLWNPHTGEPQRVARVATDTVLRARLSPDGRHLAVLCQQATTTGLAQLRVAVIDVGTAAVVAERLAGPWTEYEPPDAAWGPDSTTLALLNDGSVQLWSPFEQEEPVTLPPAAKLRGRGGGVAWHPAAGLACMARLTLIWWPEPVAGEPGQAWTIYPHGWPGHRPVLAWRPDGRLLAIADEFRRLLVVEPSARRVTAQTYTAMAVTGLSWRPDGQAIACTCSAELHRDLGGQVGLWRAQPDHEYQPIDAGGARCHDVVWHPDGEHIAVASSTPTIRIYHPTPPPPDPGIGLASLWSVAWQPHGHLLAVTQHDSAIHVLDADEPDTNLWSIRGSVHEPPAWSPDGRLIATSVGDVSFLLDADDPPILTINDARTGELVWVRPAEHGPGLVLRGWPTQRHLLLTNSFDLDPALVDVESGQPDITFGDVERLFAASPDGSMLAVSHQRAGLDIIDVATGARTVLGTECSVSRACFVPAGPYLVAAVDREELTLWNLATRRIEARQQCRTIESIAADPTGSFVAVTTTSGTIGLFDARTLRPLCQLAINGTARACDFDHTGRRLAVVGSAGLYLLRLVTAAEMPSSS